MRHCPYAVALLTAALLGWAAAADEATPGVRFGLNSFLGNLGHSEIRGPLVKTTPEDRTRYFDAMKELGVRVIRETFMNWADIEPERGAGYLLAPYDDIARKASERGIEIVALLYPVPCWASGQPPTPPDQLLTSMWHLPKREFEGDFRAFVSKMVKRYSGRHADSIALQIPIRKWILLNELDIWPATPDEYAFWLRAFWEEVKAVDPGAVVVPMGFANLSHALFLRSMLESPHLKGPGYPCFDALTFHCYTSLNAPNIYAMNTFMGYLEKELAPRGIQPDIWLDETGDASTDYEKQAVEDIKLVLHAASCGVSQVNLHGLWDIGEDNGWGVLENTPSGEIPVRKPSFTAYQTLLRKIGNNRGIEFLGPGRYRAVMPEGKHVYVLWREKPNLDFKDVLCGLKRVRVTTLQQQERVVKVKDLTPTASPVFVEAAD